MKRYISKLLLTLAISMLTLTQAYAQDVKIGWSGIVDELFQSYIVREGLRELGYNVGEVTQAQIALIHVSIGQGDLDMYAAHWVPLHTQFVKESGGTSKLKPVGTLIENSIQGYLIDKKTADATGIKYLDELKDPKKAKLFDIDGNGKADLYGCESGWGCERVIEHHLTAYGLRDTVEHKQGGYFAIIPDAVERIRSGKPTLYYTWLPMWLSGILRPGKESAWLNVKKTSLPDGRSGDTSAPGLGNLGFEVNNQSVVANVEFLNKNPKAKRFLELLTIPIADINAQNKLVNEGEKSDAQIVKHVKGWIKRNQSQWNQWVAEAKKAG